MEGSSESIKLIKEIIEWSPARIELILTSPTYWIKLFGLNLLVNYE